MGKFSSSSSKRKKRSSDSSQRKKRRGTRSKKIPQRNDDSDYSESSSTESSPCSSSGDDYRGRKRLRSKSSRKRSRRSDSSSGRDDRLKKKKRKKRADRKDERSGKKRTRLRKRRGRDATSSSSSSASSSESCSESEGRRKRGRGEERGRMDKVKAKRRRSNSESRSCSSSGHEDVEIQQARDEVTSGQSSRRLRSVIVVVTSPNDDDERKEFERYEVSREHKTTEEGKDGEAMISSPGTGAADEGGSENAGYGEFEEGGEMETRQGTDLETILRMRALENLRRFRGGVNRNGVAGKETSSAAEGEDLCIESAKVEEEATGHSPVEQNPDVSAGSRDGESPQKTFQEAGYQKESGSVSHDLTYLKDQPGDSAKGEMGFGLSSCTARPVHRQETVNLSSGKQAAAAWMQDAHAELAGEGAINEDCPESSQTIGGSKKVEHKGDNTPEEQPSSCAETEAVVEGSGGSDKPRDETKEGFEEKTMSVMRGGERVQVSYKVYIPKKTPAMARRRIKR